jgi:lipopolysaccharide/colanic/teichoic acid biosynthesis glycosyltransferase
VPRPAAKRALDVAGSSVLLVALLPVVLFVLLAFGFDVLLSRRDRGPLLYREPRVSRGRTFDLLKFRTLRAAAL